MRPPEQIGIATGLVLSVPQAEAPHHGHGLSIDGVAVSAWLSRVPVAGGPPQRSADQREGQAPMNLPNRMRVSQAPHGVTDGEHTRSTQPEPPAIPAGPPHRPAEARRVPPTTITRRQP